MKIKWASSIHVYQFKLYCECIIDAMCDVNRKTFLNWASMQIWILIYICDVSASICVIGELTYRMMSYVIAK
jgi:hypothetical protein